MVRKHKKKRQNDQNGTRSLKVRVGRECCISKRGARWSSEGIQAGGVRGRSHNVTRRDAAGEQLQE